MIPEVRKAFNDNFKQEYYDNLQNEIEDKLGERCTFRISETPIFIGKELKEEVLSACKAIVEQLWQIDFDTIREKFIPKQMQSPVSMGKPHFLQIDFGLCNDGNGGVLPQLIELQAFPSLFFYQAVLGQAFLKHYQNLPEDGFHYYLSDLSHDDYLREVGEMVLAGEKPENVILLELFPDRQKTRIDFWATKKALGIEVVCMTEVIKEGRELFYEKEGQKIKIKRIYNRVIVDEIEQTEDFEAAFDLSDDLDVEWVTHPDWFFVISKCIMPLLKHKSIPRSYYLNDIPAGLDLGKFVLKPLFSFAGQGVDLLPNEESIGKIKDRHNYILQEKVEYARTVKTSDEQNAKVELRILHIWSETENQMKPVINLARMSKGKLINVSFQDKDSWVGSSIGLFEK